MQSFSRRKKIHETEILIKESLLQQLSFAVKEIQLVISKKDEVFPTNDECNSLLVVLEAIFLHGLKKGILKTALKTVSGSEESKPSPSFWHMVCNYTHKSTIAVIGNLSQVKTDVGRSRVWIRMALNEGELTSYFAAMEKDRRALNSAYSNHAFLRDRENCDTACKLLEGILTVQFQFPVNSSILNTWSSEPLMLSGVWLPPMKTPLFTGVDVAEKIEDDEDDDDDSSSIKTSSSITTLSTILALDEAQALKMILETPIKKLNQNVNVPLPPPSAKSECDLIIKEEEEEEEEDKKEVEQETKTVEQNVNEVAPVNRGNSLVNARGWSSTDEMVPLPSQNILGTTGNPEVELKVEDYNSLLEKVGISPSKKVNYEARLKEMMQKQDSLQRVSPAVMNEDNHYSSYTSKLYKIMRETGLKAQKYTCAGCQLSIGLTFGEARLCSFTGEYYCESCHLNDTSVIPSRLIFNWDHKKYPVCASVAKYLDDICNRFLIDIKKVNPKLYSAVKEMKELRELRIQLNVLRAYFYTCREPVLTELQKKVNPREYIYEFIDHYSVNDLCQVPAGTLSSELSAIISFGKNHVIKCCLCSQKGFICEICKNTQVIYPFDVSVTYRCNKCFSIFHNTCLSSSKNCPKCRRLRNRTLSQNEDP